MKTTKVTLSWLVQFLLPIIALVYPVIGTPDAIVASFLTLGGIVVLVTTSTEGIKKLIGYNSETSWKWIPHIITFVMSVGLSLLGWAMQWGLFVFFPAWWMAAVIGIIIMGLAERWYGTDFGYMLIKLLFGIDITPAPAENK